MRACLHRDTRNQGELSLALLLFLGSPSPRPHRLARNINFLACRDRRTGLNRAKVGDDEIGEMTINPPASTHQSNGPATMIRSVFSAALMAAGLMAPAKAADILHCTFPSVQFYISTTDDNQSRLGVQPGIGDKGVTIFDPAKNGARVVVELNAVGMPDTMTTIEKDGTAVHSRQIINVRRELVAPSQQMGKCETTYAVMALSSAENDDARLTVGRPFAVAVQPALAEGRYGFPAHC